MKWYLCDICKEKFYCSEIAQQCNLKERSFSLLNRSVHFFIILKITCAQIKGIVGKNDKSSFCSKSRPACNDYLPFSCCRKLKGLLLYPPGGDRVLMRRINLKTNVQELLMVPIDLKAPGLQLSHSKRDYQNHVLKFTVAHRHKENFCQDLITDLRLCFSYWSGEDRQWTECLVAWAWSQSSSVQIPAFLFPRSATLNQFSYCTGVFFSVYEIEIIKNYNSSC